MHIFLNLSFTFHKIILLQVFLIWIEYKYESSMKEIYISYIIILYYNI